VDPPDLSLTVVCGQVVEHCQLWDHTDLDRDQQHLGGFVEEHELDAGQGSVQPVAWPDRRMEAATDQATVLAFHAESVSLSAGRGGE
jgi:hypothetical protein